MLQSLDIDLILNRLDPVGQGAKRYPDRRSGNRRKLFIDRNQCNRSAQDVSPQIVNVIFLPVKDRRHSSAL